ncbi:MAG: glycoside hydrolase family 3 protein [Desulfobacterales bacterium]|nr:glycoside hydrolase family 3 protein [Desulfobacterales bacterium]
MQMKDFNDEQMAGQRLMVGFEGLQFNDDLRALIGDLKVGGLILFKLNIETPEQVRRLCEDCQAFAAGCGQPPLFIAVDQEGGPVARLRAPFTEFPGNPHMTGLDDARHFGEITARELASVGINMDMAPVVDVAPADMSGIMADRVFGSDPAYVSAMGNTVIETLQQRGVMAVAKHFPGIGRTVLDSHLDLPVFKHEPDAMAAIELPPFEAAIQIGVSAVMLSHILYEKIDPRWPASLSPAIARDLLRDRFGYQGVTVTDDLDMGAIKRHFDIRTVIGQILAAEIDIALICHKGPDIRTAFEEMVARIRADRGLRDKTAESVERIMALKRRFL